MTNTQNLIVQNWRCILLILPSAVTITAQPTAPLSLPSSIVAHGEGIVVAKPDRAEIEIGVVTQSKTAQSAFSENSDRSEATIRRVREVLGPTADIKTTNYTVQPNYKYPEPGAQPVIAGYTVTNMVRVTTDDLTSVGRLIDAAVGTGANRIQSLRFMLKDESELRLAALRNAVRTARTKAEALASALALRIVRIISVTETSPVVVPVREVAFARAAGETSIRVRNDRRASFGFRDRRDRPTEQNSYVEKL